MELDIEDFLVEVPADFLDEDYLDEFDSDFVLESVLSDSELRGYSELKVSKEF
jgi:hypothetical protein